jgi:hypothetical protein
MTTYIGTWVYLDALEEKSKYPNNKGDSTSPEFQAVYWRCIVVFFKTSLRFNTHVKHVIFTNTTSIPTIDGLDLNVFFKEHNVELIVLQNKYPLPNNYFGAFRNQYFEFSIIDHMAAKMRADDTFLLLDSDCVFTSPLDTAFMKLNDQDIAMTYVVNHVEKYTIHGVTGKEMRQIFEDFNVPLDKNPLYSGGELLFAKGAFIKAVALDFPRLFQNMLDRYKKGRPKFNEEAHVLSYYFYKYGAQMAAMDSYIKRLWTNKNYYRNVKPNDKKLAIWHLPNEKKTGIAKLFRKLTSGDDFTKLPEKEYQELLYDYLLNPSNYKTDYVALTKDLASRCLIALRLNII